MEGLVLGLAVAVAVVVGLMIGVYMEVRYLRPRRRPAVDDRPPKGTRPQVRVEADGILYDLTDTLQRLPDDEKGDAVWQIHGPPHVVFADGPPVLLLASPVPRQTNVKLHLVGDPPRFATAQEIEQQQRDDML